MRQTFQRFIGSILFFSFLSFLQIATAHESKIPISSEKINPRAFFSFGFVLLPEYSEIVKVKEIAELCALKAQKFLDSSGGSSKATDGYINVPVRFPHSSVGHYGISGIDLPQIKAFVDEAAAEYPPLIEPMAKALTMTGENVSWYAKNIGKNTNPQTVELYKKLRTKMFTQCPTLTHSLSAQFLKYKFRDNVKEKAMLDTLLQNWGTPEPEDAPRIRPHFTLLYSHYVPPAELAREITQSETLKKKLAEIPENLVFRYLAIVELDAWGNPIGKPLHVAPLTGKGLDL